MLAMDIKLYEEVTGEQTIQPKPVWSVNGFLLHIVLKMIPLGIYSFQPIFTPLFSETIVHELLILFVVVDFWFTKNVIGRQLLGLRWFFGENEYGVQYLMFECRANDQYVSTISSKLFWLIQFVYVLLPGIGIIATFVISPVLYDVNFNRVLDLVAILAGAVTNFFFFIRVSSSKNSYYQESSQKQYQLKEKLGTDFINKLQEASIFSHL